MAPVNARIEKPKHTNDLNYPEISAENLKPIGDFILVQWEFCQDNIKAGKFLLSRPDTHKKMHYSGKVIAVGIDVDPVIETGNRLIFDQFSNFEKYWDTELGRVALIQESKQGSLFAIIPDRIEVSGSETDFNYDV